MFATDTDITFVAVTKEATPLEFTWFFGEDLPMRTRRRSIQRRLGVPQWYEVVLTTGSCGRRSAACRGRAGADMRSCPPHTERCLWFGHTCRSEGRSGGWGLETRQSRRRCHSAPCGLSVFLLQGRWQSLHGCDWCLHNQEGGQGVTPLLSEVQPLGAPSFLKMTASSRLSWENSRVSLSLSDLALVTT